MVINTLLIYFFRHENFLFLVWLNILLVISNEIFGRLKTHVSKAGLVLMGYSLAFMISFTFMFTWHGAILLGMFLGLFLGILLVSLNLNMGKNDES